MVENLEFSGARVSHRNGAGIRAQGRGLTVRASYFHDNENGILTSHNDDGWLVVEYTEFANNGAGDGLSHNIYVGRLGRFELRYSYSHGALRGHLVKSRAARNIIEYNILADDSKGTASYELDIPNGGDALIRGNLIVQSPVSPNRGIISYGAGHKKGLFPGQMVLAFNTLINKAGRGPFITNHSPEPVLSINNVLSESAAPTTKGLIQSHGDHIVPRASFVNFSKDDFRLTTKAGLAGAALSDASLLSPDMIPQFEPSGPIEGSPRSGEDPGAFAECVQAVVTGDR